MGRIGCVGIVKNEEAHIAEWLAWQFLAGFDTVFLLDNASTDATATIARALAPKLDIRVFDYPYAGPDYQLRGYEQMARALAGQYDWLAFFDTDEFLRLDAGLSLKTLLGARPEAAVAVSWAMFGSNGHQEKPAGLVLESFTRRAGPEFPPNRHVKSIIRPELMEAALNPHVFAMDGGYVDLAGRPVAWGHLPGLLAHDPDYAGGALNHYFTRSAAHWREKLARGYPDTVRPAGDFVTYDRNEVEDTRAAARANEVRALLAPLAPKYRFVLVACARWEEDCIAEWIAYHRHIGFEHLYLYCNDDAPDALYEVVLPFLQGDAPFVTFIHFQPLGQQKAMYLHYLRHYKDEAEWMMFLDIDEFLRLPRHDSVAAFMSGREAMADAVYFNWCFFGDNGFDERPAGSVLLNYTRRAATSHNPMTKVITRNAAIRLDRLRLDLPRSDFWHYWDSLADFVSLRAVNVLGRDMHGYFDDLDAARAYLDEPNVYEEMIATGIVNHYAYKSHRDSLRREQRGMAGAFQNQSGYREDYERGLVDPLMKKLNGVEDNVLQGLWAGVLAQGKIGAVALATPLPVRADGLVPWQNVVAPPGLLATLATRQDNISRFKPATQSSHSSWSFGPDKEADAARALNGVLDGTRQFHTDIEENPWWQVDLGGIATITEIHIHNTRDATSARFRDFALSVSIEGTAWVDLLEKRDGVPVGAPVVWAGPGTAWARFVRVTLLGRNFLHLSQVEVFGRFGNGG